MLPDFNSAPDPGVLGNLGSVGVFILGLATMAYVVAWFVRTFKGTPVIPSQQQGAGVDAELRLLIMGAVVDVKAFVEEHSHRNRHDSRNTITVVGSKIEEKVDKVKDEVVDEVRELKSKVERLEALTRRWRSHSHPHTEESED